MGPDSNFLRCIDLPEAIADWSLTSLQLKLIKFVARVLRYASPITFQFAEIAVTGPMVGSIFAAMRRLRAPPSCACFQRRSKPNKSGRTLLSGAMNNVAAGQRRCGFAARSAPSGVCAPADTARGERHLSSDRVQMILTSDGRPLGECPLESLKDGLVNPHTSSDHMRIPLTGVLDAFRSGGQKP